MKWITVSLLLMAATFAFPDGYTGKIVEVSRAPAGCTDYSTITMQEVNGSGTAKFRFHKSQESFKDLLAVSLSGLTSGLYATAEYSPDDPSCGTSFYLQGLTLKVQ